MPRFSSPVFTGGVARRFCGETEGAAASQDSTYGS